MEIKPTDINVATAVEYILTSFAAPKIPDFILCIGDDYTDEDMFEQLPLSAYTIKVGRGRTAARYRLKSVDQVLALLKKLGR